MIKPIIEERNVGSKKKKRIRFFVTNIAPFNGAQLHGFKSVDSLMKCYTWWYYNIHLTKCEGRIAKLYWKNGGRKDYYLNEKQKHQFD